MVKSGPLLDYCINTLPEYNIVKHRKRYAKLFLHYLISSGKYDTFLTGYYFYRHYGVQWHLRSLFTSFIIEVVEKKKFKACTILRNT